MAGNREKFLVFAENVSKTFDVGEAKVKALDNITFGLQEGEYVSIMGPSGSGKTTLLDVLSCMLRPTTGEVYIKGKLVSKMSDAELAKTRGKTIGFVFQTFNLVPRLSALENVMLPLWLAGIPESQRKKTGKEMLEIVGLGNRIAHKPSQLSGGQRQRVAIAAISLLVGGIGVMNAMFTNVAERTREIGIMKAVGATDSQIMSIFVAEAAIIGFTGGLLGTTLGTLAALGITIAADYSGFPIELAFDPLLALFGIIFGMTISIASGLLPAITAAKMEPVEALRFEA